MVYVGSDLFRSSLLSCFNSISYSYGYVITVCLLMNKMLTLASSLLKNCFLKQQTLGGCRFHLIALEVLFFALMSARLRGFW